MSEWQEHKVNNICQIIGGYAFKSKDFKSEGDIPIIKIKSLKGEKIIISDGDFVDKEFLELNQKYHINYNDYVIALTGSHITLPSSAVGRVAKSKHERVLLLNQRVAKFNVDDQICSHDFLYYFLLTDYFFQNIGLRAKGAANQANVSAGDVGNIKIKLPPLPSQQKIAKILSNYDDLIENNLKRIKLLEESAKLTYEEWFLRFKIEGKRLDIDPDSGLPFRWKNTSFADVFNINNGYAFKSEDYSDHGVSILRTRDYSQTKWIKINQPIYISEEKAKKYKRFYLQEYDLMLIMVGASIGNYGVVLPIDKGLLQNQNQWAIRANNEFKKYEFYKLLMMENLIKNLLTRKTGAARDFFRASFLTELEILLPDENTITRFNKIVQPVYEEINNLQHQNQLLKDASDILLPRLITGIINTDEMDVAV